MDPTALRIASHYLRGFEGVPRMEKQPSGPDRYRIYGTAGSRTTAYPVYDDRNPRSRWLPGSGTEYSAWKASLKGKPTVGYGTRYDLLSPALQKQYTDMAGRVPSSWIESRLQERVKSIMAPVLQRHPNIRKFTPQQQGLLASFYYNTGPSPRNKATMEAAVASGKPSAVADALKLYVKAGGKTLPGLVERRRQEALPFRVQK